MLLNPPHCHWKGSGIPGAGERGQQRRGEWDENACMWIWEECMLTFVNLHLICRTYLRFILQWQRGLSQLSHLLPSAPISIFHHLGPLFVKRRFRGAEADPTWNRLNSRTPWPVWDDIHSRTLWPGKQAGWGSCPTENLSPNEVGNYSRNQALKVWHEVSGGHSELARGAVSVTTLHFPHFTATPPQHRENSY